MRLDANRTDSSGDDLERARTEVVARLRGRGIDVAESEDPEQLVRLLDAIEGFEAVVEQKGGDLMVDEPIRGADPEQPDDPGFVLPRRRDDESIKQFTDRVIQATQRAADRPPQA